MKLSVKDYFNLDVDAESIANKAMDYHEKDWKKKFDTKRKAKLEDDELKEKKKFNKLLARVKGKKQMALEYERARQKEAKAQVAYRIIAIIFLFIYGFFCAGCIHDGNIISSIITGVQLVLVTLSILTSMNVFRLFKNDYRLFLIFSMFLILPCLILGSK